MFVASGTVGGTLAARPQAIYLVRQTPWEVGWGWLSGVKYCLLCTLGVRDGSKGGETPQYPANVRDD